MVCRNTAALGRAWRDGGRNFAIFSRHATGVTLLLFDRPKDLAPSTTIALDSVHNRTGDIWHVWIKSVRSGTSFAFQVDGPDQPQLGHRFNPGKILLDPYATALAGTDCWDFACLCSDNGAARHQAAAHNHDAQWKAKGLLITDPFDWQGVQAPNHDWADTVIYETHVRGLTVHPSSAVRDPGTFLGVVEKIPYFKELGITAVELMPVQEFYENELDRCNPLTGERLCNYWGYSTVAFFAAKESYSTRRHLGGQVSKFNTMIRELHRAGIELILDIVFNHTAEGDQTGPTLNFRGLDNRIYYLLEADQRFYRNYSGCGNTLNCNHPVVRDYVLDCLRYWTIEMHVDGFRFDLASVLGRDRNGNLLANPPLLERNAEDPILRNVKLIAEAWDAGGAYQVGSFPGPRWSEWNGRFRGEVRRFWRGDPGMIGALASRLCGSADLYQFSGKKPVNSINFITCHDGFTLHDLVSYREKHNEANGENNRDGTDENFSANYGVEGATDDPIIAAIRLRQIKNLAATLMVSRGVPMLLGGDEFRRTQGGNNNAYCQDNEISWYDWTLLDRNQALFHFIRTLIELRKRYKVLRLERFYTDADITWFDPTGAVPDWNGTGKTLACMIHAPAVGEPSLCLLFNADDRAWEFVLPQTNGQHWRVGIDTARPAPEDVYMPGSEPETTLAGRYLVQTRSLVMLTKTLS